MDFSLLQFTLRRVTVHRVLLQFQPPPNRRSRPHRNLQTITISSHRYHSCSQPETRAKDSIISHWLADSTGMWHGLRAATGDPNRFDCGIVPIKQFRKEPLRNRKRVRRRAIHVPQFICRMLTSACRPARYMNSHTLNGYQVGVRQRRAVQET